MTKSVNGLAIGFEPVIDQSARVLILGSMPGVKSLDDQQYYAHPRNHFWPIMEALFQQSMGADYESKLASLLSNNIALWDVMASCERAGSLDASINNASIEVNDFDHFFNAYPLIQSVFFNGAKAAQSFKKHVLSGEGFNHQIAYFPLPSTSPANARMSFDEKLICWEIVKSELRKDLP